MSPHAAADSSSSLVRWPSGSARLPPPPPLPPRRGDKGAGESAGSSKAKRGRAHSSLIASLGPRPLSSRVSRMSEKPRRIECDCTTCCVCHCASVPVLCVPVLCVPVLCVPVLCVPVLCVPVCQRARACARACFVGWRRDPGGSSADCTTWSSVERSDCGQKWSNIGQMMRVLEEQSNRGQPVENVEHDEDVGEIRWSETSSTGENQSGKCGQSEAGDGL